VVIKLQLIIHLESNTPATLLEWI